MAFEVALLLFLAIVIIAGLWFLARPLTEVFAEKMKFRYRDMGSQAEQTLKQKVNILEGELLAVKQQVTSLQETVEYLSKELESKSGESIKLKEKQQG